MTIKILLSFTLLIVLSFQYLEFQMMRIPTSQAMKSKNPVQCLTTQTDTQMQNKRKKKKRKSHKKHKDDEDQDDEDQESEYQDEEVDENENYKEICYEKDISYNIPLFYKHELKFISMDLTTPISWIKGENCHLEASSKTCTPIKQNLEEILQGVTHSIAKHFQKKHKKKNEKLAMIEGSSELVKGLMQKSQDLTFITKDSSRFTKFTELVLLGFWLRGEKDTLGLQRTTFINATEVSSNLNNLCDGAISLRFDEMSEKSFLQEIFDYVKTTEKVITVYLGENGNNTITLGELSTKNAELGYGGINWMKVTDDQSYGKLPVATDLIISDEGDDDDSFKEFNDLEMPTVLTLSASYIGLPKKLMGQFEGVYKSDRQCAVNEKTQYLQCKKIKSSDLDKVLTFVFEGAKVSFPLKDLVLEKHGKSVTFNIKKTFHDDYAILGEPVFKKYFTVLDYGKNKIGLADPRVTERSEFINITTLVRFISVVFIFGLCFLLCFSPAQRVWKVVKRRFFGILDGRKGANSTGEKRRLKQYSPVSDEHYDDLNDKVKEALNEGDQVQGI